MDRGTGLFVCRKTVRFTQTVTGLSYFVDSGNRITRLRDALIARTGRAPSSPCVNDRSSRGNPTSPCVTDVSRTKFLRRCVARNRVDPRADGETRTPDPFITSEVLYQLSYVGICSVERA